MSLLSTLLKKTILF